MTVLLLHAIESHAGAHWQQWLAGELTKQGHTVLMPDLPEAARPDRKTWLATVKDLLAHTATGNLLLVGHSLGVVTALDYIEQSLTDVRGLISVAGFGKDYGLALNSYFMRERDIDFFTIRQKVREKYVFYGDNDPYVPQEVLADLAAKLDVAPTVVHGGGHLNTEAGFTTFPALLNVFQSMK
jgi:predicted alpha/beta hydrolase family esterase